MRKSRVMFALVLFGLWGFLPAGALAASNLSVSPAVVEQGYYEQVVITFDLGPSRQEALVEMVVDFNQDGLVNGQEFPIEAYVVRDNEQFKIQNTVYPGVPGDSDPTAGKVRIERLQLEEQFFFGKYVVRVDDGEGVQQQAIEFGQNPTSVQIAGSVTLDQGSAQPAMVVIEEDTEQDGFSMIIPAYDGQYAAWLPREAMYLVMALQPGKVNLLGQGGGALVHRGANDTGPVDLNLTSSNLRVTGRVVDDLSRPVPYVLLLGQWAVQSGEDEELLGFAIAPADENGQYALAVSAGTWAVTVAESEVHGFVESDNVGVAGLRVTSGNVSAPDLLLPTRVVSLITGRVVRQGNGEPLTGLTVAASNAGRDGEYAETGTGSDGRFVLGVFEDTWSVEVRGTPRLRQLHLLIPQNQFHSVGAGQVLDLGDLELASFVPGDLDFNGRQEPLDLFPFATVWQAQGNMTLRSQVADEDGNTWIDATDLLLWLDRLHSAGQ